MKVAEIFEALPGALDLTKIGDKNIAIAIVVTGEESAKYTPKIQDGVLEFAQGLPDDQINATATVDSEILNKIISGELAGEEALAAVEITGDEEAVKMFFRAIDLEKLRLATDAEKAGGAPAAAKEEAAAGVADDTAGAEEAGAANADANTAAAPEEGPVKEEVVEKTGVVEEEKKENPDGEPKG